jgi:hypothetical protein
MEAGNRGALLRENVNKKTDAEIRTSAFGAGRGHGDLEAERFITMLLREPFDYTEWRQALWEGMDSETISREAMSARKAKAEQSATKGEKS